MRRTARVAFASAEYSWVKWTGAMVQGPPLRALTEASVPLPPWGFVPRDELAREFALKSEGRMEITSGDDGFATEAVRDQFERLAVGHAEFVEGATGAYLALADAFSSTEEVDFHEMDMTAPRLSIFLDDVRAAYAARGLVPRVAIDDAQREGYTVRAVAQHIGEEFGSVDKPGKWWGMWDGREIQHHVLAGFSPEITTSNEIRGGGPRRIVVQMLFTVTEAFDAVPHPRKGGGDDAAEEDGGGGAGSNVSTVVGCRSEDVDDAVATERQHFWEFEADSGGGHNYEAIWRVRSINGATVPR